MTSHADNHDLDKLKRWQKDLEAAPEDAPAVFAVFLVSGEDRTAHDVFRAFRSSFEEQGLGFAHLVIFGQHGVSITVRALQHELGLAEEGLPTLLLFGGDTEGGDYVTIDQVSLQRGSPSAPEQSPVYWWSHMFPSDVLMSDDDYMPVPVSINVLGTLQSESAEDDPGPDRVDPEEILLWAKDKIDASRKSGGPPNLNRVMLTQLSQIAAGCLAQHEDI